jgi:putative two-component system response regulator
MKPHLLVVDDDLDLLALLRMILGRNFEVSEAIYGEQAVTLALDSIPDLILLDVMLPDIDGFEVCRRLNADSRTRSIPVILVSARADVLSLVEAQQVSVADVIKKPFAPRELLQCVNRVLQRPDVSRETDTQLRPFTAPA